MRQFFITIFALIALSSCVDRVICPAFQSTYILDDSSRMAFYSPLWLIEKEERLNYLANQQTQVTNSQPIDSLGVITVSVATGSSGTDYFAHVEPYVLEARAVNKSKFGIIKKPPFPVQNYRLRTAPMENVLAPLTPEEPPAVVDYGEFVASDFTDTLSIDSTAVAMVDFESDSTFEIPKLAVVEPAKPTNELKYKYRYDPNDELLNVEQAYYNKHFGYQLYAYVPIKEKVAPQPNAPTEEEDGGFFKNLFKGGKGKQKQNLAEPLVEEPSTPAEPVVEEEPKVDEVVDDGF